MKRRLANITLLTLLITASCHKDKPVAVIVSNTRGVYIINQGGYTHGNAEISFYNRDSATSTSPPFNPVNNLFSSINNYLLGDVAQSMYIKDTFGFIVVNNSQKVEVVKIPSFKHIITIVIPNSSPRYFLPINDSIAYVTDIYAGQIHVINYHTGALITQITGVATWTEWMVMDGSNVVVAEQNFDDTTVSTLAVVNPATNSFVQRYKYAGGNINGMVQDNAGHIWIALDQDSVAGISASLCCLNSDLSVNKSLTFPMGHHPENLSIDGTGTQLYFFDTDIYNVSTSSNTIPTAAFSPGNGRNFYALGVDPVKGDVYAADALDYEQPSRIYRYSQSGSLITTFTAGIITGNFTFNE